MTGVTVRRSVSVRLDNVQGIINHRLAIRTAEQELKKPPFSTFCRWTQDAVGVEKNQINCFLWLSMAGRGISKRTAGYKRGWTIFLEYYAE
jgi:hypothetical protein